MLVGGWRGCGRTSKRDPSDMYSITMHILGGLVHAAMKSTTLGCLNAVMTRTYKMNVSVSKSTRGALHM